MWRRLLVVLAMVWAGLGPVGGTAAAPSAPGGGTVGDGSDVSCDESALDDALAGGGTVTFNCGGPHTFSILSQKTITQATTIFGGGIITINGGLATRLFYVNEDASLALHDIVLEFGYEPGESGGAIANFGTLLLDHTLIQYSQTDNGHGGGAIFTAGPTTLLDSQLNHNSAATGGALFAISAGAQVYSARTNYQYNAALAINGRGGAIVVSPNAEVRLDEGSVAYNETLGDGGGVHNQGHFTSHLVSYAHNKTVLAINATSRGNGGGLASFGPLTMTNDILLDNASRFGGGLYVSGTETVTALLTGIGVTDNRAVFAGGGLYTGAPATALTVTDSTFERNVANQGGGLSRTDTNLTILRSSIGENQAASGGGLANDGGAASPVRVYDTTFFSNVVSSSQGGAIYNSAQMDLRNLTLESNTSGVFNIGAGETMTMANSVLHNEGLNCDGDGTKPTSTGGNFASDTNCGLLQPGDQQGLGLDPQLGLLVEISPSVTKFFIPLPASPLVNTATFPCSLRDQRGALRPDACDKGAVEYRGLLPWLYLPVALLR